ncbi:hypothetical protein MNBD_GAMMA26-9 [hydrothermal vent metagenome]|uniref:Soluble ligand binding domain-containing protein n=1 Tax=hydrothermal vent metagenome TaxID=652676 RepID=A0A3B1BJK8_9ZZZZ
MKYRMSKWLVLFLAINTIIISGCSVRPSKDGGEGIVSHVVEASPAADHNLKSLVYKIGPGDSLEVFYYKNYSNSAEYKLGLGDKLFINVYDHENFSREVIILPDGTVTIPKHGVIKAEGLTISELDDVITNLHGKELNAPEVDVLIVKAQSRTNEFLSTLSGGKILGASKQVKVRTDGLAVFPAIGGVVLEGLTISEAQHVIMDKYQNILNYVAVTLSLSDSAQQSIAVVGEVKNPGVYTVSNPIVPHYALALAGGEETTADLEQIAILRTRSDGSLETILLSANTAATWKENRLNNNFIMAGDVVYVPRTDVSYINLFIDQYIRKMLPFTFSLGGFWSLGQ